MASLTARMMLGSRKKVHQPRLNQKVFWGGRESHQGPDSNCKSLLCSQAPPKTTHPPLLTAWPLLLATAIHW